MTTGGSEGVSWLDVAASGAGIEQQMRTIGQTAARSFSESFSSAVGSTLSQAMGGALSQGFAGPLSGIIEHFSAVLKGGMGTAASSAAAEFARITRDEMGGKMLSGFGSLSPEAAASGALLGKAVTGGIAAAVAVGAGLLVSDIKNVVALVNNEVGAFGKVGKDAADTLMSGFGDVVAGKAPDVVRAFGVIEEGVKTGLQLPLNVINTEIDNTVGRVPIIGDVFKSAMGEVSAALGAGFAVFDEFQSVATSFVTTLNSIGDTWENISRTISAQTVDSSGLAGLLSVVQNIAVSGAVESLKDISDSVGVLSQRLSSLSDGAGLTQQQLTSLATTYAQGQELLGYQISVSNLTAAMVDFHVPADQVGQDMLELVNISRDTGANLNDVLTMTDALGPAMTEMGYSVTDTAFFVGKMNEELGSPALRRFAMAWDQLTERFDKKGIDPGQGLKDLVAVVQDYIKAGNDAAAIDFLKSMGLSGPAALAVFDAIRDNVGGIATGIDAAKNAMPGLLDPLGPILEATKDLQQTWETIGTQVEAMLAPLGLGLVGALRGATNHISDWLQENEAKIIGWAGTILQVIRGAFATIATDLGRILIGMAPAVDAFKNLFVDAFKAIDLALQGITLPLSLLPSWMTLGIDFGPIHQSLVDATGPLNALAGIDLTGPVRSAGQDLIDLGHDADGAKDPLQAIIDKAKDFAALGTAFKATFQGPDDKAPTLQSAFADTKDGIELLGKPDTWATVHDQLHQLGIDLQFDPTTGFVTGITASTAAEADRLKAWWASQFGDANPLPINVAVTPAPVLSPDEARDKLGLPSEVTVPVTPGPSPGPAGAPPNVNTPILPVPPPPGSITPGDLGGLLGVTPSDFVKIPAAIDIHPASTNLDPNDIMGSAGIPTKWQGDVKGASPGVLMPTGFDVKDDPDGKSISDIMDAAGIPSSLQGDDGVVMNVSFTMPSGSGGVVPAGNAGGTSGGSANWDAIAGFESGGDWTITHGEGNDVTGGLQISTPTWLSHGGGAYAPKAYMASKEDQIRVAQRILDDPAQGPGAWPTTYRDHPDLFTPTPTAGAAAVTGGGAGGMPGAGVSYTPDWLLSHGIAPIFEKSASDAGGAATPGEIPAWVKNLGGQFGLTETDHGDHTLHGGIAGRGDTIDPHASWAFDFSGSNPNMQRFADYLATNYASQLVQLIHQDPATGRDTGVAGGQVLGQGQYYTTAGGSYADESDEVHVAFASPIGGVVSAATANVRPADYTTNSPLPVTFVDRTSGTPGDPQTPAPTAPGSSFTDQPPPPGIQQAPPGAPNAIQTPYGSFQYSWDQPDKGAGMTPEQRIAMDTWLHDYQTKIQRGTDDQDNINTALQRQADDLTKMHDADQAWADQQARILPNMTDSQRKLIEGTTEYTTAQAKAAAADKAYATSTTAVDKARQRASENTVQQNLQDEKKPPWESDKATKVEPDKNAETLGKGLLKGIGEELGFGNVFAKGIDQWGITKILGGLGGFALGLAQNMGSGSPGTGLYAPGQPLAAYAGQTPSSSGSSSSQPSMGLGFLSGLSGLVPGLGKALQPAAGSPAVAPAVWDHSGAPPSPLPGAMASSTPAVQPAGFSSTTTNGNVVNVNASNLMDPAKVGAAVSPYVTPGAPNTSATLVSGGAGGPL
jgi:hypothetical protein